MNTPPEGLWDDGHRPIETVSPEEGRAIFDRQARTRLGMSGAEFVRQWRAGELTLSHDDPRHGAIFSVYMLLPLWPDPLPLTRAEARDLARRREEADAWEWTVRIASCPSASGRVPDAAGAGPAR